MDKIDIKVLTEEEKEVGRKKYIEERKKTRELETFLFNYTELGALDSRGQINLYELAEQIMVFFKEELAKSKKGGVG